MKPMINFTKCENRQDILARIKNATDEMLTEGHKVGLGILRGTFKEARHTCGTSVAEMVSMIEEEQVLRARV